jgi:hypothetical protein
VPWAQQAETLAQSNAGPAIKWNFFDRWQKGWIIAEISWENLLVCVAGLLTLDTAHGHGE